MALTGALRAAVALGLAVLLASHPAWAAPPKGSPTGRAAAPRVSAKERAARAHFEQAERAYNIGKFEEALSGYQAAYEAMALPAFLFNIAQCHRNLRNHERALFFYQRYLSLDPNAPNRPSVEELIGEQQALVAEAQAEAAAEEAAAHPSTTPAPLDLTARPPHSDPATPSPQAVSASPSHADEPTKRPSRKWLWAVAAGVVVASLLAIALVGGDSPGAQLGVIDGRRR